MIYIWLVILSLAIIVLFLSTSILQESVDTLQKNEIKRKTTKTLLKPSETSQDIDIEKVLDEIRAKEKREFKRKVERKD